ncbi:protein jason [Quercus suber]|uniref:Protein jason n=1 Tax=Quercus suber TaxID=58331 RepID=A0AAW0K8P3_QUESU
MGCFLGCFGSSKDGKRRKQRRSKVQPRDQPRTASCTPAQSAVHSTQDGDSQTPIDITNSQVQDEPERESSFRSRRKVTFNSNVETYEHVLCEEVKNVVPETEGSGKKGQEENIAKSREVKPYVYNLNVRDRSAYVHPVLNPVENLTQWKAVKAKGASPLRPQKENFVSNQESEVSFSFKSKTNQSKKSSQEVAVDASLSNWLESSEATPINKSGTITPEISMSQRSTSSRSPEDRPILGALTVEELKQFSTTSSPRRSPSPSPDDMPIIGTVGTYWSHTGSTKNSGSASSYKGIPNTTSKYREDKRVNWHSTPFEARLERALKSGSAEA